MLEDDKFLHLGPLGHECSTLLTELHARNIWLMVILKDGGFRTYNLLVMNLALYHLSYFAPFLYKQGHSKVCNLACPPANDSDQPAHPLSLIRVFAVGLRNHWCSVRNKQLPTCPTQVKIALGQADRLGSLPLGKAEIHK